MTHPHQILQDEEFAKGVALKAHEAATSMDALDKQVAALAVKQQKAQQEAGEEEEGGEGDEDEGDFDMDDFL
jgi:hypothetical protein